MSDLTINIHGMDGIRKALEKLPLELRRNAARSVLRAGAKPVLAAMRSKAPVKTGNLKKSIGTKARGIVSATGGVMGYAIIGPRSGFKSKRQNLTGRRRDKGKGKLIDAPEVAYYLEMGTSKNPAHSFIRPAIDASKNQVMPAMAKGLETYLAKAVSRLKSKSQ